MMSEKNIEAIIASPPEREELVVQLFVKNSGQWGEIFREQGSWRLELYGRADGQPWNLDLEEARHVMDLSLKELQTRLGGR
jgi:hypothetical protein